jgi:uncharacterized membrane protein YbhN (UPF0104 family)
VTALAALSAVRRRLGASFHLPQAAGARRPKRQSDWITRAVGETHRVAFLVGAAGVLSTAAVFGVAWAAGFHAVWSGLLHPRWAWLAVALVGEIVAYLGYTLAYATVVRAERGAELEVPKAAALVATGFGVFLQGGGFALDREALMRAGLSEREARSRVLGLGALEYAILAPATAIAAWVILLRQQRISDSLTLPWIIGVPVGAALALVALAFKRRIERPSGWRARAGQALDALGLILTLARSPRKYGLAFAGILVYWLGDIFCLWSTLHVFYAKTPPVAQLIVGYATGYAITRRALPLAGAGIVEALLPFALGWVKIALGPALLAVVAYRLINVWLPMIPALGGLPVLKRIERRRAE